MLWDWGATLDDFFDNAFNRAVYDGTSEAVARDDCIHESACGTGAISTAIATVCAHLGLGAPSYRECSSVPHSGVTVWWSARLIWVRSPCDPSRKLSTSDSK